MTLYILYDLISDDKEHKTSTSVFEELTYCNIRITNDCEMKTGGVLTVCQRVNVNKEENLKTINVCVADRFGCDTNLDCKSIGSTSSEGELVAECVAGLCKYQRSLTFT